MCPLLLKPPFLYSLLNFQWVTVSCVIRFQAKEGQKGLWSVILTARLGSEPLLWSKQLCLGRGDLVGLVWCKGTWGSHIILRWFSRFKHVIKADFNKLILTISVLTLSGFSDVSEHLSMSEISVV